MDQLVRSRAGYKGRVSIVMKQLVSTEPDGLPPIIKSIRSYLKKIQDLDAAIDDIYSASEEHVSGEGDISDSYAKELSVAVAYTSKVEASIARYESVNKPTSCSSNVSVGFDLKLPHLECSSFSGEEKDSLKFNEFLSKFNNLIGNRSNISDWIRR